jgi:hypothetical protein
VDSSTSDNLTLWITQHLSASLLKPDQQKNPRTIAIAKPVLNITRAPDKSASEPGTCAIDARFSFQSSELGPPTPSPLGPRGRDTLACRRGGGGTQFRRRDRHSGTPGILQFLYARGPQIKVKWMGEEEICR